MIYLTDTFPINPNGTLEVVSFLRGTGITEHAQDQGMKVLGVEDIQDHFLLCLGV